MAARKRDPNMRRLNLRKRTNCCQNTASGLIGLIRLVIEHSALCLRFVPCTFKLLWASQIPHTQPLHIQVPAGYSTLKYHAVLLADRLRETLLIDHLAELLEVHAATVVLLCEMYRLILR